MFKYLQKTSFILLGIIFSQHVLAQEMKPDTVVLKNPKLKQESFYDSLEQRANRKKLTGWIYDALISPPRPYVDKKALALDYYNNYQGKVIAEIHFKALDVFGPRLNDTTRTAKHWAERAANTIHTKSNLKTIQKRLLFKIGDILDPEVMYETERVIRELPYIKDVKILVDADTTYRGLVNVTILTKDRFSFGVSGGVSGTSSGDLEVYNRNIFGIGHEISLRFVGHIREEPYLGLETFYSINNIAGRFLDIDLGYMNTYRREGFLINADKPFYTQTTKWGYGTYLTRLLRTDRVAHNDFLRFKNLSMSYNMAWAGRGINISPNRENITQLVFSAGLHNWNYFGQPDSIFLFNRTPVILEDDDRTLSNRTLYMAGLTISQRRFIQDQLIYSYGITEDIPEGFRNSIMYGYDANEFGDRHYLHFTTSNGNLLLSRTGYLYLSGSFGGYLNKGVFEDGMLNGHIEFISKLRSAGAKRVRTFLNLDYTLGIRRTGYDFLTLGKLDHIRGFDSKEWETLGRQRLSGKLEHVVFMPQQFYKFNIAVFGFADVGFIGSNKNFILQENFYSGIGLGIRLHNENLVFETFRLRFVFYPFPPDDMSLVSFSLSEQSKQRFNSFEPTAPAPLRFE